MLAQRRKDHKGKGHAHASRRKRQRPAKLGAHELAHRTRKQSTQVDAHVEDRKGRVPTGGSLRIQVANQRRDVGLKQAVSDDHQKQCGVKRGLVLDRKHQVTCAEQRRSAQDGPGVTEDPVCQKTAEERSQVHKEHVPAVDARGFRLRHLEMLSQVQREQGQHQIEAEPLPHLREEKYVKAARMLARHLGTSHLAIAPGTL